MSETKAQDDFVPSRDDPKIVRARLLKNPQKRRWYNVTPKNGWDNPNDIDTAEHYLKNDAFANFITKQSDVQKIQYHADFLRGLGISEEKAAKLIKDSGVALSKPQIEIEVFKVYEHSPQPPGLASEAINVIDPTPYDWVDLKDIPRRQYIMKPAYIPGFVSLTVAAGGAGKSKIVQAEACAIASGKPLLGIAPEKRTRVWYFNGEDPREEIDRNIGALRAHHDLVKDDLAGWFYADSGRDVPIKLAHLQQGDFKIAMPVVNALIDALTENGIEVLIVDPFVTTHNVNENDNVQMNAVVDQWRDIADKTGCAIHLVHHTRKGNGEQANIEAARGASALKDAARVRRAINTMTTAQAERCGISEKERPRYISADYSNSSFLPAGQAIAWYRFESVILPNGDCGDGDDMGVAVPVDLSFTLRPGDEEAALDAVRAGGQRRKGAKAGERWVGVPIGEALGLNTEDKNARARINKVIAAWLADGRLVEVSGKGKDRHGATFIVAGDTEESGDDLDFG